MPYCKKQNFRVWAGCGRQPRQFFYNRGIPHTCLNHNPKRKRGIGAKGPECTTNMTNSSIPFSNVPDAVEAIARGEVVIVVDAEDRENEGDYICAAEKATPESINFMLSGRGQLCVAVLPDVCRRLELSPIVERNDAPLRTAFMTPIDWGGARTGITAAERAETIRRMIEPATRPSDFVRPGHVYPCWQKKAASCVALAIPKLRLTWPEWLV